MGPQIGTDVFVHVWIQAKGCGIISWQWVGEWILSGLPTLNMYKLSLSKADFMRILPTFVLSPLSQLLV